MESSYPDSRIEATLTMMRPKFCEIFKAQSSDVEWLLFAFAPGRVNFYGEHTDYMGGYVCPAALREGCHILVGRVAGSQGGRLQFGTTKGQHTVVDSFDCTQHNKDWTTFVSAAADITLKDLGKTLDDPAYQGVCVLVHGSLPMGSGMSASACFSVALLNALRNVGLGTYRQHQCTEAHYPRLASGDRAAKIALTKQALLIETKYCGVNVGIMDQFASIHATAGCFMALDCDSLTFENHIISNITGPDSCFLLIDSMVKHELTGADHSSGYNAIRRDIEGAETAVSKAKLGGKPFKFCHLVRDPKRFTSGDVVQFVEDCKDGMSPSEYARGVFNVAEQARTLEFIGLAQPDCTLSFDEKFRRAGEMLNATHTGQRDVLGISTPELNLIQETVNKDKDVAGGRLMGGGFGGCILLLLKRSATDRVVAAVTKAFVEKFRITPKAYPVELCDGAFSASLWSRKPSRL